MEFDNVYEDDHRAATYAKLELDGTYYLAYRDSPHIYEEHAEGKDARDFGCGTSGLFIGVDYDMYTSSDALFWNKVTDFHTAMYLISLLSEVSIFPSIDRSGHVCRSIDGSEAINISGAVYLIPYIFGGGPMPRAGRRQAAFNP